MLSDEDKTELIEAFGRTLDARRNIADKDHKIHHDFVATMIEKEKRKTERIESVKTQVAGWGTILAIGSFAAGIGKYLLDWFTRNGPGG